MKTKRYRRVRDMTRWNTRTNIDPANMTLCSRCSAVCQGKLNICRDCLAREEGGHA